MEGQKEGTTQLEPLSSLNTRTQTNPKTHTTSRSLCRRQTDRQTARNRIAGYTQDRMDHACTSTSHIHTCSQPASQQKELGSQVTKAYGTLRAARGNVRSTQSTQKRNNKLTRCASYPTGALPSVKQQYQLRASKQE